MADGPRHRSPKTRKRNSPLRLRQNWTEDDLPSPRSEAVFAGADRRNRFLQPELKVRPPFALKWPS